jgi:hypothetical protein
VIISLRQAYVASSSFNKREYLEKISKKETFSQKALSNTSCLSFKGGHEILLIGVGVTECLTRK